MLSSPSRICSSRTRAMPPRGFVPARTALLRVYQTHQIRTFWLRPFRGKCLDPESRRLLEKELNDLRSRHISFRYLRAHHEALRYLEKCREMGFMGARHRGLVEEWRRQMDKILSSITAEPGDRSYSTRSRGSKSPWLPELQLNIRRYLDEQRDALATAIRPHSGCKKGPEYIIDPITNRKVPRNPDTTPAAPNSDSSQTADKTARCGSSGPDSDRPQPATKAPEPPTEYDKDELDKYRKVDISYPPSLNEELIHRVEDLPGRDNAKCAASPGGKVESSGGGRPQAGSTDGNGDPSKWDPKKMLGGWYINQPPKKQTKGTASPGETRPGDDDLYSKEPQGLELSWAEECKKDPHADTPYASHYKPSGLPADSDSPSSTRAGQPESSPAKTSSPNTKIIPDASRDMHNSCPDMYGSTEYTLEKELRASQVAAAAAKEEGDQQGSSSDPSSSSTATSPSPSQPPPPTLYKILAYDSTMQKIDIAETTSIAPDDARPLSPADVMVRLSAPSKFFPHFAPLQKQGYEIVSGSGDVLVFRKVREPPADTAAAAGVNPIDMMGRREEPLPDSALPNAGNFVSPTGFMSYVEEEPRLPPRTTTATASKTTPSSPSSSSTATPTATNDTAKEPPAAPSLSQQHHEQQHHHYTQRRRPGFIQRTITAVVWLGTFAYVAGVWIEFAAGKRHAAAAAAGESSSSSNTAPGGTSRKEEDKGVAS